VSRPHAHEIPERMTHARVVQCAMWLSVEAADARKHNRHSVAVPIKTALALTDILLEVASRNPEDWR
jgi:hypothetical protein